MARKATYDQERVKVLRTKILEDSLLVFSDDPSVNKWSDFRKELLMKYAPRILPVVSEVSGPDGGPVEITGVDITLRQ